MMEIKCVVHEPRQPSGDQIISPLFPPTAKEEAQYEEGWGWAFSSVQWSGWSGKTREAWRGSVVTTVLHHGVSCHHYGKKIRETPLELKVPF